MAFDAFLQLDGIKGESKDAKHADAIDIQSFSWGVSNATTFSGGSGGGAAKPSFQDFSFTADSSIASPQLFEHCALGTHIKSGILTLRRSGEGQSDFYIVKLSDALISSYNQAGAEQGDAPQDEFSINYAKIEVEYRTQKADGSAGDTYKAGYDIKAQTKV